MCAGNYADLFPNKESRGSVVISGSLKMCSNYDWMCSEKHYSSEEEAKGKLNRLMETVSHLNARWCLIVRFFWRWALQKII